MMDDRRSLLLPQSVLEIMSIPMQHRLMFIALLAVTQFREGLASSDKRYHIPDSGANWFQARERCHAMGMQMATIQSLAENSALGRFVQRTDKFEEEFSSFWIGSSDLADEGTFTWFATGRLMTYENWSPGEPNNDDNGNDEDCLQFVYNPAKQQWWTWNDNHCMKDFYFICESAAPDCVDDF